MNIWLDKQSETEFEQKPELLPECITLLKKNPKNKQPQNLKVEV